MPSFSFFRPTFFCCRVILAHEKCHFPRISTLTKNRSVLFSLLQKIDDNKEKGRTLQLEYEGESAFVFDSECLKNVTFIRCITLTAYRLTCTIICYLCVVPWFSLLFPHHCSKCRCDSGSTKTTEMPDISMHELGYQPIVEILTFHSLG